MSIQNITHYVRETSGAGNKNAFDRDMENVQNISKFSTEIRANLVHRQSQSLCMRLARNLHCCLSLYLARPSSFTLIEADLNENRSAW